MFGKTVVVTRAREQASDFRVLLEKQGALCLEFPTIAVVEPASWEPLDGSVEQMGQYDWVIFTSVNGVRFFFRRLGELGEDVRVLRGIRLGAIGPKTAASLEKRGLQIDLVPSEYRAEAVIEALKEEGIRGKRFLLPRAAKAREILPEKLVELGGEVDVVTTYETILPAGKSDSVRALLQQGEISCVTFTSSSTVDNFATMFPDEDLPVLVGDAIIACIGPITADTAELHGLEVSIMPTEYTIEALVDAIVDYFSKQ